MTATASWLSFFSLLALVFNIAEAPDANSPDTTNASNDGGTSDAPATPTDDATSQTPPTPTPTDGGSVAWTIAVCPDEKQKDVLQKFNQALTKIKTLTFPTAVAAITFKPDQLSGSDLTIQCNMTESQAQLYILKVSDASLSFTAKGMHSGVCIDDEKNLLKKNIYVNLEPYTITGTVAPLYQVVQGDLFPVDLKFAIQKLKWNKIMPLCKKTPDKKFRAAVEFQTYFVYSLRIAVEEALRDSISVCLIENNPKLKRPLIEAINVKLGSVNFAHGVRDNEGDTKYVMVKFTGTKDLQADDIYTQCFANGKISHVKIMNPIYATTTFDKEQTEDKIEKMKVWCGELKDKAKKVARGITGIWTTMATKTKMVFEAFRHFPLGEFTSFVRSTDFEMTSPTPKDKCSVKWIQEERIQLASEIKLRLEQFILGVIVTWEKRQKKPFPVETKDATKTDAPVS